MCYYISWNFQPEPEEALLFYEIRYPDKSQDRRLTREQALKEIQNFASWVDWKGRNCTSVDFVQVRPSKDDSDPMRSVLGPTNIPGEVFIGVFTPPEDIYDGWVTIESEDFVSRETALDFLREAGLVHLVEG